MEGTLGAQGKKNVLAQKNQKNVHGKAYSSKKSCDLLVVPQGMGWK